VDMVALQIAFRDTKTHTPRVVPISDEFRKSLEAWKRVRPRCDTDRVFVTETGGPVDTTTFSRIIRGYLAYAGLSGWSLHGIRHYAVSQIAIRAGVAAARDIAGHSSLTTTSRYVHVSAEALRSAHTEAAPLRNLLQPKRAAKPARRNLVR
jgi:integrase/recombinase XerC